MTSYELELDHQVPAALDRVWQAWTTKEGLQRWWWPGWSPTITVDFRVGGAYRIEATGQHIAVHGSYRLIEPPTPAGGPARLGFSWIWVDAVGTPQQESGPEESVDVTFTAVGSGTAIVLRHTGDWHSPEPAANYRLGWESVLQKLSETIRPAG